MNPFGQTVVEKVIFTLVVLDEVLVELVDEVDVEELVLEVDEVVVDGGVAEVVLLVKVVLVPAVVSAVVNTLLVSTMNGWFDVHNTTRMVAEAPLLSITGVLDTTTVVEL